MMVMMVFAISHSITEYNNKKENYVLKRRKFVQNYADGNCVIWQYVNV